jgi:uncharacterized protein YdgA (DUF945 family)
MSKKTLLITLIALICILICLPYVTGIIAEKHFNESMEKARIYMAHPAFNLKVSDYNRGWFSSSVTTSLEFNTGQEKASVVFDSDIKHGPSLHTLGLAKITTTARLTGELGDKLNYYLKDRPLIESVTYVGYHGKQYVEFTSPLYEGEIKGEAGTKVNWQGMRGRANISAGMKRFTSQVHAPLFSIAWNNKKSKGDLRIENIKVSSSEHRYETLWLGTSGGSISEININASPGKPGKKAAVLNLKGLAFEQATNEEEGLLAISSRYTIESLTVADRRFENGVFESELHNLDVEALMSLNREIAQLSHDEVSGELSQGESLKLINDSLLSILPDALKHSPEYSINRLSISSDKGDIFANARVKYVGNGDINTFNPLTDLDFDAMLSIPKALVKEIILANSRNNAVNYLRANKPGFDESEVESLSQIIAENNINGLLSNRILIENDDKYISKIALNSGRVTLNGRPMQLPPLK